jgi:hypothetical protein
MKLSVKLIGGFASASLLTAPEQAPLRPQGHPGPLRRVREHPAEVYPGGKIPRSQGPLLDDHHPQDRRVGRGEGGRIGLEANQSWLKLESFAYNLLQIFRELHLRRDAVTLPIKWPIPGAC